MSNELQQLGANQAALANRISEAAYGVRVTFFGSTILAQLWWGWSPFWCVIFGVFCAGLHWARERLF